MPQAKKLSKSERLSSGKSLRVPLPWACIHHANYSEIEIDLAATGDRKIIAKIHYTAGIDAEHLADFITRAINGYEKSHDLIIQMASALELCLACEGKFTWEAEHEAQAVLTRAKQVIP